MINIAKEDMESWQILDEIGGCTCNGFKGCTIRSYDPLMEDCQECKRDALQGMEDSKL